MDGDRVIVTPGARDAALVALDKATGKEVWRTAIPDLGPAGKDGAGYSSIVISNAVGREAVRPAPGPRPRRRARERRQVPVGLQQGGQRRRQHLDPDRARELGLRLDRLRDGRGARGARRRRATRPCRRASSTSSTAEDVPEPPRRHGARRQLHLRGHGQSKGFPICIEFTTGKVAWGGDIRNAGIGLRGGASTPTATSTSATRTAS